MKLGDQSVGIRLDVWLWAARMFKTRALAKASIEAGRVKISGVKCKPSRALRVGDLLQVSRGEELFHLEVKLLSASRGPASVAQAMYFESAESVVARMQGMELRRLQGRGFRPSPSRPDKQQRRQIMRLQNK